MKITRFNYKTPVRSIRRELKVKVKVLSVLELDEWGRGASFEVKLGRNGEVVELGRMIVWWPLHLGFW